MTKKSPPASPMDRNPYGTVRMFWNRGDLDKAGHVTLEREMEIRRIAALPATGPNMAMVLLARDCVALADEGWAVAQALVDQTVEVEREAAKKVEESRNQSLFSMISRTVEALGALHLRE